MDERKQRIIAIILISIFILMMARVLIIRDSIEWDEAVNIGMGKHIFTGGQAGMWEDQRPLVLPFIFGAIWALGLEPFLFGKIIMLLFAMLGVWLAYLIGKELCNERTGFLSSIILASSIIFLHHSSLMTSNLPSAVIGIAAIYYSIKKKYFVAGILAGLAFLTRFTAGIFLIAFMAAYILESWNKKEKDYPKLFKFILGYALIIGPYIASNILLYSSKAGGIVQGAIWPMTWASEGAASGAAYLFIDSKLFYLRTLTFEFFIGIFALAALFYYFKYKEYKNIGLTFILSSLIIYVIYYSSVIQNTDRYIIDFSIILAISAATGITKISESISKKLHSRMLCSLIILMIVMTSIASSYSQRVLSPYVGRDFSSYDKYENLIGEILISDPSASYLLDNMATPAFTTDRFVKSLHENYSLIVYVPDFLVCHDVEYSEKGKTQQEYLEECPTTKAKILGYLNEKYALDQFYNGEYYFVRRV